MELSIGQQLAFNKYIQGQNIFITGPGGSGKSELIKKIYQHACSIEKEIHVTALTGCAAILLNCKAKTLHSWSGIGLGNGTIEEILKKIKSNKFSKEIWKTTDILIIDEISMLSLKLFDLLNQLGQLIRGNSKPFGGIQLVFSGDFFQLPPVGDKSDIDTQRFCFESLEWYFVFTKENHILLQKIFRQTDETYSTMLNQIRQGKLKNKTNEILMACVGRKYADDLVVEPTKLFPTRIKVENINNNKMALLSGIEKEYKLKYIKDCEISKIEKGITEYSEMQIHRELEFIANNLICEKEIKIKVGAQVMSIINISNEKVVIICNGSQGIVIGFCEISGAPMVKFNNGIEMVMAPHTWSSDKIPGIGVSQVPLILAWALTIHKSQGATLDTAEIDVGSCIFECGQTYVALSRVKSLSGLYLTSYDVSKIRVNKKVKEYYDNLSLLQLESIAM